jgi:ABC-type glycerol-3-phosphate transport system substrate-binding protein
MGSVALHQPKEQSEDELEVEIRIVDEKIYGVPMDVIPLAMYYSLKAFEEVGLSESDIPQTWDQFLEIAHSASRGEIRAPCSVILTLIQGLALSG